MALRKRSGPLDLVLHTIFRVPGGIKSETLHDDSQARATSGLSRQSSGQATTEK